jgi:hypothetical protein
MAACAYTVADSSSISPLSYTPSSGGDSFQDANNFSFLMDADVSPLMDWHRDVDAASAAASVAAAVDTIGSDSADSTNNQLESNNSHRRLQGLAIARPSNPSPPSSSSQRWPLQKNSERESGTTLSPLELIEQSRAYRHRPPHNIYVRHCHGLSSPLCDTTRSIGPEKNQHQLFPPSLQHELLVLIEHHRTIHASLATIDEEMTVQRLELLRAIAAASGDAKDVTFTAIVERLGELREERRGHVNSTRTIESILQRLMGNASSSSPSTTNKFFANEKLEGQWFTLTKPTYSDCLGFNDDGDPMYRLGRMSFEMFFPGDLICAIQAVFNPIMKVVPPSSKDPSSFSVPKTLQEEVKLALAKDSGTVLKTYQ